MELRYTHLGADHARGALRRMVAHGMRHEDRPGGPEGEDSSGHLVAYGQADSNLHERGPRQAAQVRHGAANSGEDEALRARDETTNAKPKCALKYFVLPTNCNYYFVLPFSN